MTIGASLGRDKVEIEQFPASCPFDLLKISLFHRANLN